MMEWIEHGGGMQPVSNTCRIAVKFRDGCFRNGNGKGYSPSNVPWEHDSIGWKYPELHVVAYRILPHPR